MNSEAFSAWASIYSDNLAEIYISEPKELKRVAMIMNALKQEFNKIESGFEERFVNLKRKVSSKKQDKKTNETSGNETKLADTNKTVLNDTLSIDLCSPNTISPSSENSEIPCSINLMNPSNVLNSNKKTVSGSNKLNLEASTSIPLRQKDKNVSRKKKTDNSFSKYSPLTQTVSNTKLNQGVIGNKKENQRNCGQTTKDDELERTPKLAYKTETVRGKARIELPGWSCRECEEFYEALGLSPESKRAKMNACSKHRGKFKPAPDTPKGFWDLTFPATPDTENR